MHRHALAAEADHYRLPAPPPPPPTPSQFALWSPPTAPNAPPLPSTAAALHAHARALAEAVARPSLLDRGLFTTPN